MILERTIDKQHGIDRTIRVFYDFASNITKIVQEGKETDSFELVYDYDLKDRIINVKDCFGAVYQYEYDKNNRTVTEIYPQAVTQSEKNNRTTDTTKFSSQNSYHYLYDYKNNLLQIRDSKGHILEENEYRIDGTLSQRRTSNGNELSYTYGIHDEPTTIHTTRSKRQGKPAEVLEYDAKGRIVGVKDGNQNQTRYQNDLWGKITQIFTAEGGTEQYTYDYAGHVTSSTDPNGNTITYRFNSQGKVCEVVDQGGNSDRFYYDREGRQILHINRNGEEIRTTYNVDGNPVLELGKNQEGKTVATRSWDYDSLGRVSNAKSGNFIYSYEYEADGKLKKKTSSGKTILSCTYYIDGSLRTLTDTFGKTSYYFYDYKGNLSSIQDDNGEELARYEHTIDGKLKEIRYQNGIHTTYEYDTDGNISRLSTLTKEKKPLCDFQYDYDLNGNRTAKVGVNLALSSKQKNISSVTTLELGESGKQQELQDDSSNQEFSLFDTRIYYQYDAMNRLLEESYYENGAEETIQYEYDFCGNRLKKRFLQNKEENSFIKEEQSWYNQKNQLIKRQSENETIFYTYDKQGNTIQEVGGKVDWTYSYNPFGQQKRSENTNGYFQENFYDGEYLRAGVNKNGSSSKFLYYRGELLSEITKKQGERKGNRLILGYGVVASEELGLQNHRQENNNHNFHKKADRRTIGFYHFDEQNSTTFITGNNQEIQNSYTYDAFGNIRNQKETLHNRIRYTGQQYDRESNQYYLRARYYNPTLGRFTQEDVYRGDGLNLYDYCKGNPVVWYDPSGYRKKTFKYPERIPEAQVECKYVVNILENIKKEGSKTQYGKHKTVHTFLHADGSVSIGLSGEINDDNVARNFSQLSEELENILNASEDAIDFSMKNNGKKKYNVARNVDPELMNQLNAKGQRNKRHIEFNIGQCAEPKAASIASKNDSPIIGMDTRSRFGKNGKYEYIGKFKDYVDRSQMKACLTCKYLEKKYMKYAMKASREKEKELRKQNITKCNRGQGK